MPKTVIVPVFLESEYQAILALGNLGLPTTFSRWLEHRTEEKAKHVAQGRVEQETVIHPHEFALYAQHCGQNISLTMLNAFSIAKTNGYK